MEAFEHIMTDEIREREERVRKLVEGKQKPKAKKAPAKVKARAKKAPAKLRRKPARAKSKK
jgi:hypothetical protein